MSKLRDAIKKQNMTGTKAGGVSPLAKELSGAKPISKLRAAVLTQQTGRTVTPTTRETMFKPSSSKVAEAPTPEQMSAIRNTQTQLDQNFGQLSRDMVFTPRYVPGADIVRASVGVPLSPTTDPIRLAQLKNAAEKEQADNFGTIAALGAGGTRTHNAQDAYNAFVKKNTDYSQILSAPDFKQYSEQGANIQNPSFSDAHTVNWGADKYADVARRAILSGKAEDVKKYLEELKDANKVRNIVTFSRDNIDAINDRLSSGDKTKLIGNALYSFMRDDEVSIYNYLLAKEGEEPAQRYLDSIEEELNKRQGQFIAGNIAKTENKPLLHSVAAGAAAASAGLDNAVQGAKQFWDGKTRQPTTPTQFAFREMQQDQLERGNYLGYFTNDVVQTVSNMAPSILLSVATGGLGAPAAAAQVVGAASMGTSAAGNAYNYALEKGYSTDRSRLYGLLIGASEGALSYLLGGISPLGGKSAEKLLTKVASIDNAWLRVAAAWGIKGGSETIEENLQNFFEPLFRSLLFNEKYDAPTVGEIAYTALVSFLTTGMLEGGEIMQYRTQEGAAEAVRAEMQENAQSVPVGISEPPNAPGQVQSQNAPAASQTEQKKASTGLRDPMQVLLEENRKKQAQQNEKAAAETQRNVSESNTSIETLRNSIAESYENGTISAEEYDAAMESVYELESLDEASGDALNAYDPERLRRMEANDNGRSSISDDGSQRAESQSAGEQAGALAEGTGRYQSRQVQSQRAASRRDDVSRYYESRGKQPVSARDYLGTGKVNKVSTVQEMPAEMVANDAELNGIAEEIRAMGMTPHLYVGDARLRNGNSVDGLIRGKDVYIRVDGDVWTATQNWDHEKAHAILRQSPGIEARLYGEIVGRGEAARRKLHQTMQRYREAYHGIYDMDENGNEIWDDTVQEMILQEILADAYAGKDTFAQGVEEYTDVSSDAVSQIENRGGEVRGPPEGNFSIGNIEGKNGYYGIGVFLDTNIFDSKNTRGWSKVLRDYVYKNMAGKSVLVYDDAGNSETIYFARKNDRVRKGGAKSDHKVIDKLARYRGDNIRALTTVHLDEALQASKVDHVNAEHDHQWMDEKGWIFRTVYLQDRIGNIYKAELNIANGRDRLLLYDVTNIRKIDQKKEVTGGDVPSNQNGRGSHTNGNFSVNVPQKNREVKLGARDSTGRELSNGQREYFKDSKVLDRDGNLLVLYHQTEGEFTVFDPRREGAGRRDDGTPFGIFMKSSNADIGLNGKRQMELYANITNPLVATNREDLSRQLKAMEPEYDALIAEHAALDSEYHEKFETAKKNLRDFMTEWREQNPDASRRALYDVPRFNELYEAEDTVVEEWTEKVDELSIRAKETLTQALRAAGYDGVILKTDVGSWGRSTDAYIALDPQQVKKTDNLNPTENTDIRFSVKEPTAQTDGQSNAKDPIESMPTKARKIMESAERKLQNSLGKVLGNPAKMPEGVLEGISREISNEFLETGTVSDETIDRTFEQAYSAVESEVEQQHGVDAEDYRQWAERDYIAEVAKHLAELRLVKRYAAEKAQQAARDEADTIMTLEELGKTYQDLKAARRGADKAVARNLLTESDERKVHALLRGDIDLDMLKPETDNVRGITEVYNAKLEYENVARRIRRWNAQRKENLRNLADELLATASDWKDKPVGLMYSRETMERNIRDIVPDKKVAQEIIDTLFTPIHNSNAAATKMKNEYRDRVRELKLSRKVDDGNTISEAAAVQLLGEAEDNIRHLEQNRFLKERDGKSLEDWRGIVRDMWDQNPNLDAGKIRNAVAEFRQIYDALFEQLNTVRMRNGYEPINYRKGYFPHFQNGGGDSILAQFGKALGISTAALQLPTTINGITHTFKPGKQWFSHELERKGNTTVYDAVEGFDTYIEGVADVIHQTDNIQRLRAFATEIRMRTADEALKKQVRETENNPTLNEEEKRELIEQIWKKGKYELGKLAVEIDEYTNIVAGKKSHHDRMMEHDLGRKIYYIMTAWENRVAANMVAINPGSWITNLVPIAQGAASLDARSLLVGLWNTARAIKQDDGFVSASTFLTNRRGSDPLVKMYEQGPEPTKQWRKALRSANIAVQRSGEWLSGGMEFIDSIAADTLVRARYYENKRRGLSDSAAMADADAWAAGVMADRSKGAMPTLFYRKNPLVKLFSQFQLEVNNQLSYVFKDIPREMKEKGVKALAMALFKFMINAYLYNELYEKLIGRRPALDPIGMLKETADDVKTEGVYDAGVNLAVGVVEELPFIGSLLGGGRLPISSAIPDFGKLWQAISDSDWDSKKRVATAAKELAKPATYLALPFGGGQVKKVVEGVSAIAREGSYSVDSSGADILQYPVYASTPGEAGAAAVRALFFGKSALPTAQEWVKSDFDSLGARQTEVYQSLISANINSKTAYETIREWERIGSDKEMTSYARGLMQRGLITGLDLSDRQKLQVYATLSGSSADTRVEKFARLMDKGLTWREIMLAFNSQQELNNDETVAKASDKAAKFAEYVLGEMTVDKALAAIEEMKFYVTMASAPSQGSLKDALDRTRLSAREKRAVWYDYCELYGWKAESPW